MLLTVAQVLVVVIVLASLAGFFGTTSKYLELPSHFQLQYLILTAGCLLVFITSQAWLWAIGATFVCALKAFDILPWYVPRARPSSTLPTQRVRLLLTNVDHENTQHTPWCTPSGLISSSLRK
jgi:hypothetical protein